MRIVEVKEEVQIGSIILEKGDYIKVFESFYNKSPEEILDDLPKGSIFDDAVDISGIFKKSSLPHNKVLVDFEQSTEKTLLTVSLLDLQITQPFVLKSKVLKLLKNIKKLPPIPVVIYNKKEMVLMDGHHRLAALWLVDKNKIEVLGVFK